MITLWHYTCDHSHQQIGDTGQLRPHPGSGLIWLTDLDVPMRDALGLTSDMLLCDRTQHRYRVTDTTGCVRWVKHPARRELRLLEDVPNVRPLHWWVAEQPVPVVYDPIPTVQHG